MNDVLAKHPAYGELRQLLGELSLISHAPIQGYDFAPSEVGRGQRNRTSDRRPPVPHLGAHQPKDGDTKVPRGSDVERRPRAPKAPRVEGDAQSEKRWDAYEDDLAAWKACYHRRTSEYFHRQLERCETEFRLRALRDEAAEVLESWRRLRIPAGQPPALGDPQWKRWVVECGLSTAELVRMFGVSRQYLHQVRRGYGYLSGRQV